MTGNEERRRAYQALQHAGCDLALVSSPGNVTYLSGWEAPLPIGALAELAYGPALVVCEPRASACRLVVAASGAEHARNTSELPTTVFGSFDSFEPIDLEHAYLSAVRTALDEAGLSGHVQLGIEGRTLPYAVGQLLAREYPQLQLVDIAPAMEQARAIKTVREIALLRRAAAIGDVAHQTLADLVQSAGHTEFDMWAALTAAMYRAVGYDLLVSGELVTGPRTAVVAYPNGPRERITAPGDAALMDISGRVAGYWFDCTNTHVVGDAEPTLEQRKYAKASQDACEAAIDSLRPGRRASDAALAAEAAFRRHGLPMAHYAGHQIGVTVNELPRLVLYDHTMIEEGMVFSVEPGAYQGEGGSFGARSEKMVLVTASGPELLSHFRWGI